MFLVIIQKTRGSVHMIDSIHSNDDGVSSLNVHHICVPIWRSIMMSRDATNHFSFFPEAGCANGVLRCERYIFISKFRFKFFVYSTFLYLTEFVNRER